MPRRTRRSCVKVGWNGSALTFIVPIQFQPWGMVRGLLRLVKACLDLAAPSKAYFRLSVRHWVITESGPRPSFRQAGLADNRYTRCRILTGFAHASEPSCYEQDFHFSN